MARGPDRKLMKALLKLVPADGSTIGNQALRGKLEDAIAEPVAEYVYEAARDRLNADGVLLKSKGRGGSVRLADPDSGAFDLEATAPATDAEAKAAKARNGRKNSKAKKAGRPPDCRPHRTPATSGTLHPATGRPTVPSAADAGTPRPALQLCTLPMAEGTSITRAGRHSADEDCIELALIMCSRTFRY